MSESNRKLLKILAVAMTLFTLALFLTNLTGQVLSEEIQQRDAKSLTYFEDFSLRVFDRPTGTAGTETFTSEDLKAYKVVVFNGWGPWCGSCTNEMPDLNELYEEYKSKGLLVVGVDPNYEADPEQDGDAAISNVLESLDIRYPILLGDERFLAEVEPTMRHNYPGTWAVDANGRVLGFVSGAMDASGWRSQFNQWLKEARS